MSSTPKRRSIAEAPSKALSPRSNLSTNNSRPKKPPPITPRRFKRFFTPRTVYSTVKTSRRALRDITAPALNRTSRKRKFSTIAADINLRSSPDKRVAFFTGSSQENYPDYDTGNPFSISSPATILPFDCHQDEEDSTDEEEENPTKRPQAPPVQQFRALSTSANLLSSRLSGRRLFSKINDSLCWQGEIAGFYSASTDLHPCISKLGPHMTLPFCTSSCNTNSLVAVGDEEGAIRLLDSASNDKVGFSSAYLFMKHHDNAIMDLSFSGDDALLATASGDHTSRIIDMQSQSVVYCLSSHKSSVKKVQFQSSSNNNIIATCGRDGNVNLWDLRCEGAGCPVLTYSSCNSSDVEDVRLQTGSSLLSSTPNHIGGYPVLQDVPVGAHPTVRCASAFNAIRGAHGFNRMGWKSEPKLRPEYARGREGISVTSLAFLKGGREQMFVTASEVDATVKLWDLRVTYNTRRGQASPVSWTQQPSSHERHRRFGLTSMALSGDGARLYTLCRDHTVYTYSTPHLILGHAPEFAKDCIRPARNGAPAREGLGPLYGFRHSDLRVASFYTKLSVRKAHEGRSELLAVGSSDDCAIIIPTCERYLTENTPRQPLTPTSDDNRPALRRTDSNFSIPGSPNDDGIPIYYHGSSLVRGHVNEVTSVAWTTEGGLATVSDDFTARYWRENANEARKLRIEGEGEGRRWMCGWADVNVHSFDDE